MPAAGLWEGGRARLNRVLGAGRQITHGLITPDIQPQVPGGAAPLSNCFCLDYRPSQMTVGLVPPVRLNLTNVHTHSRYLHHLIVTLKGFICLARELDYKLFRNYGKSHVKETLPL